MLEKHLKIVQNDVILQDMSDCSESFQKDVQSFYDMVNEIYHLLNMPYTSKTCPVDNLSEITPLMDLREIEFENDPRGDIGAAYHFFKYGYDKYLFLCTDFDYPVEKYNRLMLRDLGWALQNFDDIILLKMSCICFIKVYEFLDTIILGDLVYSALKIAKKLPQDEAEKLYNAAEKLYAELMKQDLEQIGEEHIEICQILGEWLLSHGNEAKRKDQFDLADQFYQKAMTYENREAFLQRGDLHLNYHYFFATQGITTLREWDILCLKRNFICEPSGIHSDFDQACLDYQENRFDECAETMDYLCSSLEDNHPLMGAVNYNMAVLNLRKFAENDIDAAIEYLKTAAEHGTEEAALLLAVLYYGGTDCNINDEEAYAYLLRGYALNHGIAGFYRSQCFKEGRGIEQRDDKALAYNSISNGYYLSKFQKKMNDSHFE